MKPALAIVVSLLFSAAPALAQSAAQLKKELRTKEAAAQKEPDALCEVAMWASEKGLAADAKRLFTAVLKAKPDHEGANTGLGNALFEGKWMAKKLADELRGKALAAEYAAKGLVEVDGIWVEKDHVDDAKRGVFHHAAELVSKGEKHALMSGKVRHPDTGQLIDAKDAEKAQNHYYPIGKEGRWVDQKEADTYFSDFEHPWMVRTTYGTILTTLPMAKIQELKAHIDRGCERVGPLLGGAPAAPAHRPVVMVAATLDEYRQLGTSLGDETSATSAFLMREEATLQLPMQGNVRAGICIANDAGWAPFNLRHAAGLAYLQAKCADAGATVPLWFQHGVASFASRFENDSNAAHFGKLHIQKGGVKNLKGFFAGFTINGDMESKDIDYNLYQAGLMFHFATRAGDKDALAAMVAVTEALAEPKKGGVEKAVAKLTSVLTASEEKIVAHLQKLIADNR